MIENSLELKYVEWTKHYNEYNMNFYDVFCHFCCHTCLHAFSVIISIVDERNRVSTQNEARMINLF